MRKKGISHRIVCSHKTCNRCGGGGCRRAENKIKCTSRRQSCSKPAARNKNKLFATGPLLFPCRQKKPPAFTASFIRGVRRSEIGFPFNLCVLCVADMPSPACSLVSYSGWEDVRHGDLGIWNPLEFAPSFVSRMRYVQNIDK